MDSQKTLVLEKKISGNSHGASVSKSSVFMAHAIHLPEVILTRMTRDELTSTEAILISKWQRVSKLIQETTSPIALFFFFTYIQSTSMRAHRRQRTSGNLNVTRVHVPITTLKYTVQHCSHKARNFNGQ